MAGLSGLDDRTNRTHFASSYRQTTYALIWHRTEQASYRREIRMVPWLRDGHQRHNTLFCRYLRYFGMRNRHLVILRTRHSLLNLTFLPANAVSPHGLHALVTKCPRSEPPSHILFHSALNRHLPRQYLGSRLEVLGVGAVCLWRFASAGHDHAAPPRLASCPGPGRLSRDCRGPCLSKTKIGPRHRPNPKARPARLFSPSRVLSKRALVGRGHRQRERDLGCGCVDRIGQRGAVPYR